LPHWVLLLKRAGREEGKGRPAVAASAAAAAPPIHPPLFDCSACSPACPALPAPHSLSPAACRAQVKKLQCEVPLDASSRNYNTNAEPSK
jgi:hypothetical protein